MKKEFNAKHCIEELNNIKKAMQLRGDFRIEDLQTAFINAGLPTSKNFWWLFMKANIVEKSKDGKYRFVSEKPIYYEAINQIYHEYKIKQQQYSKTCYEKKKAMQQQSIKKDVTEEELNKVLDEKTQQAINHLKSLGFKILRPTKIIYDEM
jgi:hypothetical protein